MPPNFGIGMLLRGRTLGIWGYGRISLVAGRPGVRHERRRLGQRGARA